MRYDTEHKDRTRQRVLTEAAAAIRENGPAGIGVADLMGKVGLTHGGFYAHFKSKDDLVAAAITEMFEERYETFRRCTEGKTPAKGLEKYIDVYLSARHRDERQHGCPIPILSGELARLAPAAKQRFQAGVDRLLESMSASLEAQGHADAASLAMSIFSEMAGALAMSRAVADVGTSDRLLKVTRDAVKRRVGLNDEG